MLSPLIQQKCKPQQLDDAKHRLTEPKIRESKLPRCLHGTLSPAVLKQVLRGEIGAEAGHVAQPCDCPENTA